MIIVHGLRAAVLAAVLLLCACASPTVTLAGFDAQPSAVNFSVVDARPATDKTQSILSLLVTSCDYGIYRLADEKTAPSRLVLLRYDLEMALGESVKDMTLTVTRYQLYVNNRAPLRQAVNGMFTGIVPSLLASAGEGCTKEQTTAGWFDASEVPEDVNRAFVIELGATLNSKDYSVHQVVGIRPLGKDTEADQTFGALRAVSAALAAKIREDLAKP